MLFSLILIGLGLSQSAHSATFSTYEGCLQEARECDCGLEIFGAQDGTKEEYVACKTAKHNEDGFYCSTPEQAKQVCFAAGWKPENPENTCSKARLVGTSGSVSKLLRKTRRVISGDLDLSDVELTGTEIILNDHDNKTVQCKYLRSEGMNMFRNYMHRYSCADGSEAIYEFNPEKPDESAVMRRVPENAKFSYSFSYCQK